MQNVVKYLFSRGNIFHWYEDLYSMYRNFKYTLENTTFLYIYVPAVTFSITCRLLVIS